MNPTGKKETRPIILHEGDFLRLIREGQWEYIERNNCRGIVIILAMTDDEKVILVEQYRQPVHKKVIEFPAGLICDDPKHKNESMRTAAKRELLEETGYKAGRIVKLLTGPVSSGLRRTSSPSSGPMGCVKSRGAGETIPKTLSSMRCLWPKRNIG